MKAIDKKYIFAQMTTTFKIHCNDSLIDEAFFTRSMQELRFVMQLGTDGAMLAVNEKSNNRFIAFEHYTFQETYQLEDVCVLLDELKIQSKLFKAGYSKLHVLIVNNLSTLVPKAVYEEDSKKTYLKFNVALNGEELVFADELKVLDAKNIFALPVGIKNKLDTVWSNISYHHFSSILIEVLLRQHKNQSKKVVVHVQASGFQVIVSDGKQLLFYNTFEHHTPEDFIYYLLFVFEQLQLNPEKAAIVLIGEIEKNSAIHLITQKYIRHVSFLEHGEQADYSYQLQNLPKHSFFTLFNIYSY